MSVKMMDRAWTTRCKSSTQKLVLLKLADNATDEGEAWPKQSTIAEACELTTRAVRDAIEALSSAGHLTICPATEISKKRVNGNQNGYRLHPVVRAERRSGLENVQSGTTFRSEAERRSGLERNDVPVSIEEPSEEPSGNQNSAGAPHFDALTKLSDSEKTPLRANARDFIAGWCTAHLEFFGVPYHVDGPDASAAKQVVRHPESVAELVDLALWCWRLGGIKRYFNAQRGTTIRGFGSALNAIKAEARANGWRPNSAVVEAPAGGAFDLDGNQIRR